jgi:hypothetical protein
MNLAFRLWRPQPSFGTTEIARHMGCTSTPREGMNGIATVNFAGQPLAVASYELSLGL